MRGNLRFALTALTWAVILLAIYAITARAQTRGPLHGAAGVGWAAQAGAPGLPVLKGKVDNPAQNYQARVLLLNWKIVNRRDQALQGGRFFESALITAIT